MFLPGLAQADPITLQNATATYSQAGLPVSLAIDSDNSAGWAISRGGPSGTVSQTAAFQTATDVGYSGGTKLTFTLDQQFSLGQETLGKFAPSVTAADRASFCDGLSTGGNVGADSIWTVLTPTNASSTGGATMTINADGSILVGGTSPDNPTYIVTAVTNLTGITGIRLQVLEDPSLPQNGPGRYPVDGNFVITTFAVSAEAVPEPSTIVLLASGLIGLLCYAWRKRR